jgi:hypothetical protein
MAAALIPGRLFGIRRDWRLPKERVAAHDGRAQPDPSREVRWPQTARSMSRPEGDSDQESPDGGGRSLRTGVGDTSRSPKNFQNRPSGLDVASSGSRHFTLLRYVARLYGIRAIHPLCSVCFSVPRIFYAFVMNVSTHIE